MDKMLEVPGIDGIFVGPNDMSISLGFPDQYDREEYKSTVKHIIDTAGKKGIPVLVHHQTPELAIMDEDKDSLTRRVERLDTGMAWAEDPPARTRHIVSNVEAEPGANDSELKVYSNIIMYRTRAETEVDFYVGAREDVLRREGGSFKVAYRKIILDQTVLLAKNVSNFF